MGFFLKDAKSGATESEDGVYRHHLWREWDGVARAPQKHWLKDENGKVYSVPKSVLWILLNPSKASHTVNDPTTTRLIDFTKAWGYDRMELINLFSYRATDPADLKAAHEHGVNIVGANNEEWARTSIANASLIVLAWGNGGTYLGQHLKMLDILGLSITHRLGLTRTKQPVHPLYIPANTKLVMNHLGEIK